MCSSANQDSRIYPPSIDISPQAQDLSFVPPSYAHIATLETWAVRYNRGCERLPRGTVASYR
jgi:hypothetical protein